ncbi:MAG: cell division protein FtsI (penicillin-binding protein 3), partial [Parcubacteria group bacterium Gr01-1014_72]
MGWWRKRARRIERGRGEIDPDDVLLDATNLPQFDRHQFEGRFERPITPATVLSAALVFLLIALLLTGKTWILQVANADRYRAASEDNRLEHTPLFGARGVLYDRSGIMLADNAPGMKNPDIPSRRYADIVGVAHAVGYLKYPLKDRFGNYYSSRYIGLAGAEKFFDGELAGTGGLKIVETDATGNVRSESLLNPPVDGATVTLSLDAPLTSALYGFIASLAREAHFEGGAGVLLDVTTGEVLAFTSYP